MTTHSPSTVALVPKECLFEMHRTGERVRPVPRQQAVAALTDGLIVAHEGMRIVLCEGTKDDARFYRAVTERAKDNSDPLEARTKPNSASEGRLESFPAIHFVSGHGKQQVREAVKALRSIGLTHFSGIVDSDDSEQDADGVWVLPRHEIENFLYDPLLVWALLHSKEDQLPVNGAKVLAGQHARLKFMPSSALQAIADYVCGQVEANLGSLTDLDLAKHLVSFTSGQSVYYPRWVLRCPKEQLVPAYTTWKPALQHKRDLIRTFRQLDLIPTELFNILNAIHCGI